MGSLAELRRVVRTDLYRYGAPGGARGFLRTWLADPSFQCIATMRACRVLTEGRGRGARLLAVLATRRMERKWGISIPWTTDVGDGLFIAHHGGVVVNAEARIGRNVNLHHGVTIGAANRGRRAGAPVIGDGVWIGPGATVIGAVTIGDGAAIGANAVVVDDVPAGGVVAAPKAQPLPGGRGAAGLSNAPVDPGTV